MPATAPLRHLKECRRRKCNTGEIPHATLRNSICIFEEKVLAKNSCRGPVHRYPGRLPSARQCSCACRYNLSPGKISPRRTVPLTKLVQGKQSIADHVCSRMFVDLDTDALHLKTYGRGGSRDTIRHPKSFFPERYLDNFLLLLFSA